MIPERKSVRNEFRSGMSSYCIHMTKPTGSVFRYWMTARNSREVLMCLLTATSAIVNNVTIGLLLLAKRKKRSYFLTMSSHCSLRWKKRTKKKKISLDKARQNGFVVEKHGRRSLFARGMGKNRSVFRRLEDDTHASLAWDCGTLCSFHISSFSVYKWNLIPEREFHDINFVSGACKQMQWNIWRSMNSFWNETCKQPLSFIIITITWRVSERSKSKSWKNSFDFTFLYHVSALSWQNKSTLVVIRIFLRVVIMFGVI